MAGVDWQGPSEWKEWSDWLSAGLHGRNRWRLSVLLSGILFAFGRRTVSTWLRAAGVSADYVDYYYFLASLGRNAKSVSLRLVVLVLRSLPLPERLLLVIDDSPTKRYGPKVEGADVHHNPTPGPADQEYLYGHVWVTLALAIRHPWWGAMALPLRAMLYVRERTLASIPPWRNWKFRTKLQLAASMVNWIAPVLKHWGKQVWVVVDGAYAKRSFLRPTLAAGWTVVSRLRKDAHLRTVPKTRSRGGAETSTISCGMRDSCSRVSFLSTCASTGLLAARAFGARVIPQTHMGPIWALKWDQAIPSAFQMGRICFASAAHMSFPAHFDS